MNGVEYTYDELCEAATLPRGHGAVLSGISGTTSSKPSRSASSRRSKAAGEMTMASEIMRLQSVDLARFAPPRFQSSPSSRARGSTSRKSAIFSRVCRVMFRSPRSKELK